MPEFSIEGAEMQLLKVTLSQGEKIYADGGHLISKDGGVKMNTTLKGGLLSGLKRAITGGTFFVTELIGPGKAILAGIFPGKIFEIDLNGSNSILAESHSFLAAEEGINYDSKMSSIGAGVFAGEGLFFAKFGGAGKLFLHAYGGLSVIDLRAGERIQVEAGHLLAFEDGMRYSISSVGGIKSMLFSHEGWFFVELEGPGRIYLHTVTAQQLANVIEPFLPRQGSGGVQINF
ncbi:MAG: TIGR00266 family protein [Nitrososphaeria archaeon]|nr:TIGR00266 family protein [Conexivisphaerales archaeon]